MKDKITSILRHFFTGAAAIAVDAGLINQEDADSVVRLTAAAVAIIISRVIIWGLGKINFSQFFNFGSKGSGTGGGGIHLPMIIGLGLACGLLLPSCAAVENSVGKVTGSIFYKDPTTGAKGGLSYGGGKVRPWAKVPYIDKDGNVIGEFEIESAK